MYICDNTISTIENTNDGYKLTLYSHKVAIFSKTYKTYTGAAIAQTKMLKKYDTLVQGQQGGGDPCFPARISRTKSAAKTKA